MTNTPICQACGAAIPANGALSGMCAPCMLRQGMQGPAVPAPAGAADPNTPPLADIRRDFPQLEILELVGRGGMGLVYRARQRRLGRDVALKILTPDLAHRPDFAERFLREAQAMAKLSHPNIVTVHDFGEREARYFLVMEYVDGTPLRKLMERGQLDGADALGLISQVCTGVQYAHDQGVVHRDIKPENILMDSSGGVRIVDFGLARLVGTEDAANPDWRLTRSSQVMGTPHYMAPEQMHAPRSVDQRADVYSLGVLLYEMLMGELPVGTFPMPSERHPWGDQIDEILRGALESDPARRIQSAGELGARLDALSTADSAQSAAGRPVWSGVEEIADRLPFNNSSDSWGGLAEIYGLVTIDEGELFLEYRTRDCLDLYSSAPKELRIPLTQVLDIEFKSGWFGGGELRLRGRTMSTFMDFPGFQPGSIRLYFKRDYVRSAKQFTGELQRLIGTRTG